MIRLQLMRKSLGGQTVYPEGGRHMGATEEAFPASLREAAGTEPILSAVAELVAARGIDVPSVVLAEFFLDDQSFYFGLLVTRAGQVYQFGYDHLDRPQTEGKLSEWEDLTESWQTSIYQEEIGRASRFAQTAA